MSTQVPLLHQDSIQMAHLTLRQIWTVWVLKSEPRYTKLPCTILDLRDYMFTAWITETSECSDKDYMNHIKVQWIWMFSPLFLLLLTLALGGFWCDYCSVTYLHKTINSTQFNSCCWDKIKLQSVWLLKSSHLILSAFCKNLMFTNYWNCGNMILRMLLHVCFDGWNASPDYSTGYWATLNKFIKPMEKMNKT